VAAWLESKTEKVTSLSPGRGTLTNKWVPKTSLWWLYHSTGALRGVQREYLTRAWGRYRGNILPGLRGGDRYQSYNSRQLCSATYTTHTKWRPFLEITLNEAKYKGSQLKEPSSNLDVLNFSEFHYN